MEISLSSRRSLGGSRSPMWNTSMKKTPVATTVIPKYWNMSLNKCDVTTSMMVIRTDFEGVEIFGANVVGIGPAHNRQQDGEDDEDEDIAGHCEGVSGTTSQIRQRMTWRVSSMVLEPESVQISPDFFAGSQLRDDGQVGDLAGGPPELEETDEGRVVDVLSGQICATVASDAVVEHKHEAGSNGHHA